MKLVAEIGNVRHLVEVSREGSITTATVDERTYEFDVREPEPGVVLVIAGGRVFECRVDRAGGHNSAFVVDVGGRNFSITLIDPKRLRSDAVTGHPADGSAQIVAPMHGKIVRVLAEVGAAVKAGDGVIVVEAMKMQNEMKSPRDGIVVKIHSSPGDTVNAGDVLAVIE
jgi:biotin carboxyl carrier protein